MPIKPTFFSMFPVSSGGPGPSLPPPPLAFLNPPPLPGPVPIPYPNISSVSMPLGLSSKTIVCEAQAQGFSKAGAEQIFLQNKVPAALPDVFILSRFSQSSSSTPDAPPSMPKVLVNTLSLMTPAPATAPATATSTSASPTPTAPSGPKV